MRVVVRCFGGRLPGLRPTTRDELAEEPVQEHSWLEPLLCSARAAAASRFRWHIPKRLVVGMVACVTIGCGPATDRLPLSGTVTLDGAPLDRGTVRFTNDGPTATKSAGALIRDGEFLIPREKGLPPGTYRLQITSPDRSGQMVRVGAGPNNPGMFVAKERIPESYNVRSEHVVELTASGENKFSFTITSAP